MTTIQTPFEQKQARNELKSRKPPSYLAETLFVTTMLFFLKFYSLNCFASITFVTILIPFMIYSICCMFGAVLSFVTSLQIDTDSDDF